MQERERLELSREEMRTLGYRVIDMLVEHSCQLSQKPVTRKASRQELERLLREPLPGNGVDSDRVLKRLQVDVFDKIMHLDHPRFFAFVPSPSNFVSVMADALASGFNVFAGTWLEGSGPAQIELVTVDWLRQACGLPESAGGLFVSGGSMANLTALAVAMHTRLDGRSERAVVYCSDQTHSSIDRGLRILGFKDDQLRKIPTDTSFRLDLGELSSAISTDRSLGLAPFCVVANAGTTNTGAVDPLPELASFCRVEDLWLHVDGAYGASAVLCERGRQLLEGLDQADSLALDPHKWLFQPYEIGCVLVRDCRWLKHAFQILPEYLIDTSGQDSEVNFSDYGIQLTRGFRALKLWMSLQVFGLSAFAAALNRGFELAELAESVVDQLPGWEVVTPAQMG
ncbi:MAG TPA: aminotransferase class V-fold PLP-dependent enzyme, partial [Anaerolineae bacterium]|nr:aminotransferase class V-fold PLP-dependent enzyme [Anaerolineae bacterium]